jgi:iron complex outermembrane receptor protein
LPVGVVTFANGNTLPNALYATYLTSKGEIWVTGLDVATDAQVTDRMSFDVAYSFQNKAVFPWINGGNGLPLMSNSPRSRGSLGLRYRNEERALGFELRTRYNESYTVNSGVYATNFAFPLAAGQTGAIANPTTGPNRCAPVPAGSFCYENVPEAVTFDAQVSKTFELSGKQKLLWSINAQNMFDNRARTFPGVPEIGRMLTTRLSYSF